MALLDVRIISGGQTYYLINSSGVPTAGGSATGAATTPYSLVAKDWMLQNANAQMIMGGGPPFRVGSSPLYRGYDDVQETVTIGIKAANSDNAVALIQQLSTVLNTALYSAPAVLFVQPPNNTNPVYFEIYAADVQPTTSGDWLNVLGGFVDVAVRVTWIRSPFGGRASLATLLNNTVLTNTGSGNANTASLGALDGDLINEGQPLNIRLAPSASNGIYLLSTVKSHLFGASVASAGTTSSTSFVPYTSGTNTSTAVTRDNRGLKVRAILRFKSMTNPSKARIRVSLTNAGNVLYYFPVRALGTDTTGQLLDCGGVDLSSIRNSVISGAASGIGISIDIASSDGTSITVQLDYSELLLYYDFATIITTTPNAAQPIYTGSAQNINGSAWLPQSLPLTYSVDASDGFLGLTQSRGTIPRAFSGASLWMAMLVPTTLAHNTAHTATILCKHAPLYRLLRGAG